MYAAGVISPNATDYGSLSGGVILFNETDNAIQSIQAQFLYRMKYFIPLPYGVTAISRPHSVARYNGRTYIVGCYNYNVMLDEYHRMWKQGMRAPMIAPTIGGAAGTGRTCYLSWWDSVTAERSPLSPGTEIGSGSPRTWTLLPGQAPDELFSSEGTVTYDWTGNAVRGSAGSRIFYIRPGDDVEFSMLGRDTVSMVRGPEAFNTVYGKTPTDESMLAYPVNRATHLELWMSLAGGSPRLVMRVPIGTGEVVESTAVGLLGETYMGDFQRFPRCTMNTIYHDRQVMAGNAEAPDTVYLSDLFYPERYSGMYFRARNGEPIVSVIGTKDYCLIMTATTSYVLQGYTENDMTLTVADPNIGAITHVGNTVIHGVPYIWTTSGPYMFNGSWHPLSPENRHYIREEQLAASVPFEFWQGTHDPIWNTWNTGGRFVMDYTTVQPEAGGGMQTARFAEDDLTSSNIYPYVLGSSWKHLGHFMAPYGASEGALFTAIDPIWGVPRPNNEGGSIDDDDFSFYIMKMGTGKYTSGGFLKITAYTSIPGVFYCTVPCLFEVHTGHNIIGGDGGPREAKIFRKVWYHIMADGAAGQVWQSTAKVWDPDEEMFIYTDTWNSTSAIVCPFSGEEDLSYPFSTPEGKELAAALFNGVGSHMPGLTTLASGRGLTVKLVADRVAGRLRFSGYGGYFVAGPQSLP